MKKRIYIDTNSMNVNETETMEFKSFKTQVNILDKLEGESIRERYIEKFVNSTHPQYQEQIQKNINFETDIAI